MGFEPQNPLEQSFMKAATDPAARPQFYKDLIESEIYILQEGAPPTQNAEHQRLSEGTQIQIRNVEMGGKQYVPFYSSLKRFSSNLTSQSMYLRMKALDFFSLSKGAALVLNPGSEYGKEFLPEEAASILDGSIWQPDKRHVVDKPTQVLSGQPKNYPSELTHSLSRLFSTLPEVKRAWVAQYYNPSSGEQAHTLIAIEQSGDWAKIGGQFGIVANSVVVPEPPVDFMQLSGRGRIEDYFENVDPFYQRIQP